MLSSVRPLLSTTKIVDAALVNRNMANTDNNCYVIYRPRISESFIEILGTGQNAGGRARVRWRTPVNTARRAGFTLQDVATWAAAKKRGKTRAYLRLTDGRANAAPARVPATCAGGGLARRRREGT
jgi:hypothetical protein